MGRSSFHSRARLISLGGILSALSVIIMLCAGILQVAVFASPMLAGLVLIPLCDEFGTKNAIVAYLAVSLLSAMTVPDIEAVALFVAFFGYYPIIRRKFESIKIKSLRMLLKFLLFNLSIVLAYVVIIKLFGLTALKEELFSLFGAVLLFFGNILFYFYDRVVWALSVVYVNRFRKRIFGNQ